MITFIINPTQFGLEIKKLRAKKGESLSDISKALNVDRSYISKIENGREIPPLPLLNSLLSHFSVTEQVARDLVSLIHYGAGGVVLLTKDDRKEVKDEMNQIPNVNSRGGNAGELNVNLIADKTPILYTDSVFITSTPYGIVLNVAQSIDNKNQQIVARIGMSREHAKILQSVLSKHLAMTHSSPVKQ